MLKGVTAHIPIYADATYLFIFRSTASGIAAAINTLSSELAAGGARTDGSLVKATLAAESPTDILLQPIFNPVGGYGSYVVPAAFVLILQQTLLIGAAMLTGMALAQAAGGAFASVLGRGIAHLTIYLPALALYFIVLPHFYGFSALGDPLQLLALGSVFILATSFMGQAVGAWFKRPETPTLIFLATSLPQFFLTGFAWPREAIPEPVRPPAHLPVGFRDRRHCPHQPARREPCGRWRRIGAGSGSWRLSISRLPLCRRILSSGGRRRLARLSAIIALGFARSRRGSRRLFPVAGRTGDAVAGVVRTTEVRIAPEVGGQLTAIKVHQGDACACGRRRRRAVRDRADRLGWAGARAARRRDGLTRPRLCRRSRRADRLARGRDCESEGAARLCGGTTDTREYSRHSNDTAAQQSLDQATNDVASARADVAEAEANHAAAVTGPTREERAIADAAGRGCSVRARVLERRLDKTVLRSPVDGIVSVIVAEIGENVRAGQPVLAIAETGKQWLSFNAREDLLHGLTVGTKVDVRDQARRRRHRHWSPRCGRSALRDLAGRARGRRSRSQYAAAASRSARRSDRLRAGHDSLAQSST